MSGSAIERNVERNIERKSGDALRSLFAGTPRPPGRPPVDAQRLDAAARLLVFNWRPAAYAHAGWLDPWFGATVPNERKGWRLLRRASILLLHRHQLMQRCLHDATEHDWLFWPKERVDDTALALGTAMLGGWVRESIDREQVSQQLQCLGAHGRARALTYATSLRALPHAAPRELLPALNAGNAAVIALGRSCLSALLPSEETGARERFAMRFEPGALLPLNFTTAQCDEARRLVQGGDR